jgi:hypothetical protein
MLRKQREFWKSLKWYEKFIVLQALVPGVLIFKSYLATLIYVAKLMLLN